MDSPTPTAAELAILQILWRGPATVRTIHDAVYGSTGAGYTGALKLLQNMLAKGLVARSQEGKQHVYSAAVARRPTLNRLLRGWMDSIFAGSPVALAMQALDARSFDPAELEELKEAIRRLEAGER